MGVKVKKYKGSWYVFIDYQGHRKAKKVGSRAAAEKVKRQIEARLALGDLGVLHERDTESFSDYSRRWLEEHVKVHCKLSTAISYEQVVSFHLVPRFGALRLDHITRDQVKSYLSGISCLRQISPWYLTKYPSHHSSHSESRARGRAYQHEPGRPPR